MTYLLRFLPEVEDDAAVAYYWYEGKVSGLGEEFLRAFYASAEELVRTPLLYPPLHRRIRRRLLRRFPYAIYFTLENDHKVVVMGLFHCARDPKEFTLPSSTGNAEQVCPNPPEPRGRSSHISVPPLADPLYANAASTKVHVKLIPDPFVDFDK